MTSRGVSLAEHGDSGSSGDSKSSGDGEVKSSSTSTSDSKSGDDPGKVEFKVENEVNEVEDENKIEIKGFTPFIPAIGGATFTPPATKVEINANNFEIIGTISSISGSTIVVAGQTIVINPAQVNNFEQKGVLTTGALVKVEGPIVGGTKFAREIKVFGTNGQQVKIEIKGNPTPFIGLINQILMALGLKPITP